MVFLLLLGFWSLVGGNLKPINFMKTNGKVVVNLKNSYTRLDPMDFLEAEITFRDGKYSTDTRWKIESVGVFFWKNVTAFFFGHLSSE